MHRSLIRSLVAAALTSLVAIATPAAGQSDGSDALEISPLGVEISMKPDLPPGARCAGSITLTNATDKPVEAAIELALSRDGRLDARPLPDPLRGADLALGARSWTVADGQRIAEQTLVDGLDYTAAETAYRGGYWTSAEQFVELDREVEVAALGWQSGDANWIWKVDVAYSLDGQSFADAPDLQGIDLHQKWGRNFMPKFVPFRARTLRLRYHRDGAKMDVVRMPAALYVWNGVGDESFDIPRIGQRIAHQVLQRRVEPRSTAQCAFQFELPLETGQYAVAIRVRDGRSASLFVRHAFVEPRPVDNTGFDCRFGVNGSRGGLAAELRKLGVGWVRFENLKWPFVSPAPDQYAFDGHVAPWVVNVDQILADYRDAGLHVLPMMFLTPEWAADVDPSTPEGVRLSQPPRDDAKFGQFAFQTAARYGGRRLAPELLLTEDKRSGLERLRVFELGNEPNLNPLREGSPPPTWGAWAGTMDAWWDMWRGGVDAVRRADPDAIVAAPGMAGMTVDVVDELRRHRYDDGTCPLDLADIINVHYYSGRVPPETALGDVNSSQEFDAGFVEHLQRLVEWRDEYKPGAPIWMTETGYDTAGPIGTDERTQAARLPRVVALCLANGLDKVFVYRESGSTASQHAASGLLRDDLSRRPSWYTYAQLIRQLEGLRPGVMLPHADENVWLQSWSGAERTMLMANCVRGEARLGVELGPATVVDAFGAATRVESTADIELGEFPVYLRDFATAGVFADLTAQAARIADQRNARRQADAQCAAALYNFGDAREPVGIDIGRIRYFTPVDANCQFNPQIGHGFVGAGARRNDARHWLPAPLERHAVDVDAGETFQAVLSPGRYRMRLNAAPHAESCEVVIDGADEGSLRLTLARDQDETAETALTVGGQPLRLQCQQRCLLRWLTFVAEPAP